MTMVELLFASSLSVLVAGSMALLIWVMTRANQAVYGQDLMIQEGEGVMRDIEAVLRAGSRGQGGIVVLSPGNVDQNTCTARVRVPRSTGITEVPVTFTSEIRFTTDAGNEQNKMIIDEDVNRTTDALQILSQKPTAATALKPYVTNIQFGTPIDPNSGNTPVQSSIRVTIKLVAPGQWSAWRGKGAQGTIGTAGYRPGESYRIIVRTITLREP